MNYREAAERALDGATRVIAASRLSAIASAQVFATLAVADELGYKSEAEGARVLLERCLTYLPDNSTIECDVKAALGLPRES